MNAQQLRNSILQQAIQGKLVPQDPADEPASVLLQRIRKEKECLVKEGKLKKKDLESKPIEEDEIPFEIPMGWEWVKIEDITIPIGNKTNQIQSKEVLKEGKVPVVSQGKELIDGYSNEIDKTITESPLIMFGDHTRNVKYIDFPFVIGADGTKFFKPILCDARFLYYLIFYIASKLRDRGYARHYSLLKEEPLPLPPLAEQRRIVAKIEELMPLVERYGKAQQALDQLNESLPARLRQSILQEAIQGRLVPQDPKEEPASELLKRIRKEKEQLVKEGKLKKKDLESKPIEEDEIPFEIPESWEWVRYRDVFIFNPRNSCEDDIDAGYIPMTYIESGLQNRFRFDVKKWKDVKSGLTHLADGDIAFAKITPCITNMKSAIMRGLPNGVAGGTTELNVFRVLGDTMERKYILYFHASPYFMNEAVYKGTAGQQRIMSDYVLNKPFPLPPLSEQKRIVAKVEELFGVMG